MRTLTNTMIALLATAAPALAASGAAADEYGFLTILFLAFGAAIVVFQMVPAAVLFCSMLKGLFTSETRSQES